MNRCYQFELAGQLSGQVYEAHIPKECSMQTLEQHNDAMLCWGLLSAIHKGHKMNCSNCYENKINYDARLIRLAAKKKL